MADQLELEENGQPIETEEGGGQYLEPEESVDDDNIGVDPYLSPLAQF